MSETTGYEFKMVQLPQTFVLQQDTGKEIAVYLEKLSKELGVQGWEFYRIDAVGVMVSPGCLQTMVGAKQSMVSYNVVSFRRAKAAA